MLRRLRLFLNPFHDGRYEDLGRGNVALNVFRDLTAGLIVAMVAIPLAMGFAMASGLRPEQGIVGGAVAGLVGALFGGSKYQVYGPTAAFIPLIAGIVGAQGYEFLILASICAGVVLIALGAFGLGRVVSLVPHSVVVGFTIGIAATIALSQSGEILGLVGKMPTGFFDKARAIAAGFPTMTLWAVVLAVGTVIISRICVRISPFLPGPLIALAAGTILCQTVLADAGLTLVRTKFGEIPQNSLVFTAPMMPRLDVSFLGELLYATVAIVFVCAVESLLCSRMADRLAGNRGTPFHADKELFGQGVVNILVVLLNGFPHTGALARTATNIKLGALSPLAGIAKFGFKLALAFYLADALEVVPMACIGGVLLYVATNMVKKAELDEVFHAGRAHTFVMIVTAVAVLTIDFLTGVAAGLVAHLVVHRALSLWDERAARRVRSMRPRERARPSSAQGEKHAASVRVERPAVVTQRATLPASHADARRITHDTPTDGAPWMRHIQRRALVPTTAFVHPQATLIGRVVLGDHVHVAAGTSIRADEGTPFFIGPSSNVQDGVIIHALKARTVEVHGEEWAVFVGRNVSIAHGAIVHGPCYIGDDSFIGFQATVHDSVVGHGCAIGHGAIVVGVEIPPGKYVPAGSVVDTADKVAALPNATEHHASFNEDVVEVNRGLAAAYREYADLPSPSIRLHPRPQPAIASQSSSGWSSSDRF